MGSKTSKEPLSNELSSQDIAVLQSSSKLSEEEIRKIYAEYKNECPSGSMSKREYHKLWTKLTTHRIDQDSADFLFDAFDKNQNGSIDFSEFLVIYIVQNNISLDVKLDLVFNILDKSHDGKVTYDELRNFWKHALQRNSDKDEDITSNADMITREIFEQFGIQRNARLNKQQFIDGCKNNEHLLAAFA